MNDIDFETMARDQFALLKKLEWSGVHVDEGEELESCPWCDEPELQGSHLEGCKLEEALSVRRPAAWEEEE